MISPLHILALDSDVCPTPVPSPVAPLNTYTFLNAGPHKRKRRREREGGGRHFSWLSRRPPPRTANTLLPAAAHCTSCKFKNEMAGPLGAASTALAASCLHAARGLPFCAQHREVRERRCTKRQHRLRQELRLRVHLLQECCGVSSASQPRLWLLRVPNVCCRGCASFSGGRIR